MKGQSLMLQCCAWTFEVLSWELEVENIGISDVTRDWSGTSGHSYYPAPVKWIGQRQTRQAFTARFWISSIPVFHLCQQHPTLNFSSCPSYSRNHLNRITVSVFGSRTYCARNLYDSHRVPSLRAKCSSAQSRCASDDRNSQCDAPMGAVAEREIRAACILD
ncbi:hypothetical protein QBC35DRAFT_76022 [Podospora australis]|uniref:Uncharacterized protein n=1 Tax=Podospora australis TaxID=1536484 RepID=A0AAN6WMF9_9PEZI|nr:hypothetical protein QBC35DRAFT_76022 [Podospora australis]